MRPSLHYIWQFHLLIRKYASYKLTITTLIMIEETISMKMNTMQPKPNDNIPYKQYAPCPKCSFPPFMSVQTDKIAPHYTCMNPICVRCPGTPCAKLISILDNTGQPALIQASQHACVEIRSVCITAHILLRDSLLLKARVVT